MSMFATFPYEDRIELFTDGANYTEKGTFMLASEKVWRSRSLPMFITGRGNTGMVHELAMTCLGIAEGLPFGEAVQEIEKHFDKWRETHGVYDGKAFQLHIAGWSPETGFCQFHVVSHQLAENWMEPMRLNTVWGVFYAGPDLDGDRLAEILTPERVRAGGTVFGPEFCQLARETVAPQFDTGKIIHGIGAHIDHTVLSTKGVETRRLLTWPDRRFRKLDPSVQPIIHLQPSPCSSPINVAPPAWVQSPSPVAA